MPEEEAFPLTVELLQAPSGKERILYKVVGSLWWRPA